MTVSLGRFDRSLERVTLLIALLGFSSLVVTGEAEIDSIALATIGLLLGAIRHRLAWTKRERNWTVPSLVAFALCVVHWLQITRDPLPSIILFTTYLLCLRVLTGHSLRDRLQVFAIAFGMLLLASVLTTSFLFLPICLVMGMAMIAGLVLVSIRRSAQATLEAGGNPEQLRQSLNSFMSKQFYRGLTGVSLALYLITIIFFFGLPRYQGHDWFRSLRSGGGPGRAEETETLSGAGESVGLNEIERIRLDHTIAMRVAFYDNDRNQMPTPPVDTARLRGIVLREFDGQAWHPQSSGLRETVAPNQRRNIDLSSGLVADLNQVIYQESGTSPYIHGVNRPVEMSLLGSRARELILNERDGWVRLADIERTNEAFSYLVVSSPIGPDPQRTTLEAAPNVGYQPLRWDGPRSRFEVNRTMARTFYTSMPRPNPWISTAGWDAHAAEIAAIALLWASEGNGRDPIEIANIFAQRFRSEFSYSLEPQVIDPEFPVLGFLNETREGHCEYFATSMVLMLRSIGIPARLATGYLSQEWNDAGQFFVVRESHAHAWVEVYSPDGRGWLTWDPTPPDGRPEQRQSGSWTSMTHWLDAQRHHWYTWVIDLSQSRQMHLFRRIGIPFGEWRRAAAKRIAGLRNQISEWDSDGRLTKVGWSLIGLSLAGAITLIVYLIGSRLSPRRTHALLRRSDAPRFYRQLIHWLKGQGHERPRSKTPAEFARALTETDPDLKQVETITDLYYQHRYGKRLSPEDQSRAEKMVDDLTE